MAKSKQFDVVIFGVTGYTGQLVARYFLAHGPETNLDTPKAVKWALAGRNQAKLEQLKQQLKPFTPPSTSAKSVDSVPTILADSNDLDALRAMVQSTKVVLTVVGPYAQYGSLLVQACAENGVHYCDLTAELLWVNHMKQQFEGIAKKTGARIVHACGFESVPSDMTAFTLADYVRTETKSAMSRVELTWTGAYGSLSGGTCASALEIFDLNSSSDLRRMANMFFLTDEEYASKKASLVGPNGLRLRLHYDKVLKKWTSIFLGSVANAPIVLRSNMLLDDYYGSSFVYQERLALFGGFLVQCMLTWVSIVVALMVYFRFTRAILRLFVPAPGTGPSENILANGFVKGKAFAYDDAGKLVVSATIDGVGDFGYLITSKMVSEVALCLARDEHDGAVGLGGFLTPASACGRSLAKRLSEKKVLSIDVQPAIK